MRISAITGSQVWGSSSRSLTNFGSGALTSAGVNSTSIAAVTGVDLRPSAGILALTQAGIITGGTATGFVSVDMYDGTTGIPMVKSPSGANQSVGFAGFQSNARGMVVFNHDAAIAGNYETSQILLTI